MRFAKEERVCMKRWILYTAVLAAVAVAGCDYGESNGDDGAGDGDADRYLGEYFVRINNGVETAAPSAYTLTVAVSPAGGGSVSHPSLQSYPANKQITVTATPFAGYTFAGWSGAPLGADIYKLSVTFNINSDLALVANFQPVSVQSGSCALTVNAGNGGTVTPSGMSVLDSGSQVTVTAAANADYIFAGWTGAPQGVNAANESITFNIKENTVLTANFRPQIEGAIVPGATLIGKLNYLDKRAESHNTYIVEVNADETIAPYMFQYTGAINITVLLIGNGVNRTIKLSSHGRMFTVRNDVTLILGNNVTLQGHSGNSGELVYINGGTFKMNSGSAISGNGETGVNMYSGTFEMTGGSISGNKTSANGGGVYMYGGVFNMSGGTISGNTASNGGGVYVSSGTFTMTGGSILGNKADKSGGGVYDYSTFVMHGGAISGNTAAEFGGGVYVSGYSVFKKIGGGTVTGYNSDRSNGNVVKDYSGEVARCGHAVYAYNYSASRRKETTAGPEVDLSVSGSTFEGGWDQ
jgi:uncharacterized repeat protein (TIGR02543 family)